MVDFPYCRCHRCCVTVNQIHFHRLYYTVTLLPIDDTYITFKIITAIIHHCVSFFAPGLGMPLWCL
jgi:hypothetical protein